MHSVTMKAPSHISTHVNPLQQITEYYGMSIIPETSEDILKMCPCVSVSTDGSATSPPMFCSVMAIPAAIFPGVPKAL